MKIEQKYGKTGVLLVNVGSPDAPTKEALRPYLREFLSDRRVIDLPRWQWLPILYLMVLTFRPKKSAQLYSKIWTEEGSPLVVSTERLVRGIHDVLVSQGLGHIVVDYAMRYGNPSIQSKLDAMRERGVDRILVVPMYPQYSDATTASVFDGIAKALEHQRFIPELRFVRNWHDHPHYIEALAETVTEYFEKHGKPQKLIVSYHGVPKRYLDEGDPYFCHCHKTTRLLVERLQLKPDEYQMVFQSHFGKEVWLQPYADETLAQLPSEGVKRVAVICPAFSTDCLETLEEMAMGNKELFLESGGESYDYIPCLNERPMHIEFLTNLICKHGQGWEAFDRRRDRLNQHAVDVAMELRDKWEETQQVARTGSSEEDYSEEKPSYTPRPSRNADPDRKYSI